MSDTQKRLPDYSEWLIAEPGRLQKTDQDWVDIEGHYYSLFNDLIHPAVFSEKRYQLGANLLEIGCGTGFIALQALRSIPPFKYLGIDKAPECIKLAFERIQKNEPRVQCLTSTSPRFMCRDIRLLNIDDLAFRPDITVCIAMLKHFGEHEWRSILQKILSFAPIAAFSISIGPYEFDDGVEFHHTWVDRKSLYDELAKAGHSVTSSEIIWEGVIPHTDITASEEILVTKKIF